jgi:hypothetical protein
MDNEVLSKALCGICIISCGFLVILLAMAFSSLEATEYGLNYSWISKTVLININLDFPR